MRHHRRTTTLSAVTMAVLTAALAAGCSSNNAASPTTTRPAKTTTTVAPTTAAATTTTAAATTTTAAVTTTTAAVTTGAPCTQAAIAAGAGPTSTVQGFGCTGTWAYAYVTTGHGAAAYTGVIVLSANGTAWQGATRAAACNTRKIAPALYTKACTTS